MIYFCEVNKTGHEHVMINSCLLNLLARTYAKECVYVWIDKTHFELYKDCPSNIKIKYGKIIQPEKSNKIKWAVKLLSEILWINRIIISAKKNKVKLIFFSSLSPIGNYYLSLLIPFITSDIKFVIALHGEIELAKPNHWTKRIEKVYGIILRKSFLKQFVNRKFLVLNEIIYDNSLKFGLLLPSQMMCIEHPFIFTQTDFKLEINPITFGHLGVAKLNKKSQLFFKLAEEMSDYVQKGIVRFIIVGPVFEEMEPYINEFVQYDRTTDFLSREDFERNAAALSYSVFFYNEESYELTSSGAVLDALAFEKPIIGFKIKLFEHLFADSVYPPGYLFEDFNTLIRSMKQIIDDHSMRYETLVKGIRSKKQLFSIDAQFPSFKKQIELFFAR